MAITEANLEAWRRRPSDTEQSRYEWTRSRVSEVLRDHSFGDNDTIDVYAKGSYPNFTNVRLRSDVDIAVELTSITKHEFTHAAAGLSMEDFGYSRYEGSYDATRFKSDVFAAISSAFGDSVSRGDKCIHIRESRSGLEADVVVCQRLLSHVAPNYTIEGIRLWTERGEEIDNYPNRRYEEGVAKNTRTSRRYKRVVRMAKKLNEVVGRPDSIPSYLIESLIWNVPDQTFGCYGNWHDMLWSSLNYCLRENKEAEGWLEADNFKYLFHSSQPWSEGNADRFLEAGLQLLEAR